MILLEYQSQNLIIMGIFIIIILYFLQHTGKDNVPALISVSCVAVVASVLMFIIGFICGHCFSQRRKKLTQHEQTMSTSTAAASNEQEGDLELKDNVTYVTLRPK